MGLGFRTHQKTRPEAFLAPQLATGIQSISPVPPELGTSNRQQDVIDSVKASLPARVFGIHRTLLIFGLVH